MQALRAHFPGPDICRQASSLQLHSPWYVRTYHVTEPSSMCPNTENGSTPNPMHILPNARCIRLWQCPSLHTLTRDATVSNASRPQDMSRQVASQPTTNHLSTRQLSTRTGPNVTAHQRRYPRGLHDGTTVASGRSPASSRYPMRRARCRPLPEGNPMRRAGYSPLPEGNPMRRAGYPKRPEVA